MRKTLQAAWLGLLLLLPGVALAQSATISGTVTDVDGEPVFGANVVLLDRATGGEATAGASFSYGATSDVEGRYSFEVPASGVSGQTATLRASSLGYASQAKDITLTPGLQTHNFVLRYDAFNLDELVVTGVAEATPKKKLAFTVETVGAEELERAPASDAVSALAGKIAGASVVSGSGEPGSGASILLRGITGINTNNSPLVIIDGVILADSQVDFDALDIESIEVVKGAAASSLYGSRAQAGVIQIRTKRGAGIPIGQTRVTVRNEIGRNFLPNRIELSNSHPFALTADGSQFAAPDGSPLGSDLGAYASAQYEGNGNVTFLDNAWPGPTYDHLDELINTGTQYSNQIAVSQNTQSTNFRMSFTNFDQGGIVIGTEGYNRKSVRMNLDHKISPALEVRGSGFYSQSTQDAIGDINGNVFYDIYFNSPFVSLTSRDEKTGKIKLLADPKTTEENPLYAIEEAEVGSERSRVTGNFTTRWSPVTWFDLAGSFSYDRSDEFSQEFYDIGYEAGGGFLSEGRVQRWNDIDEAINADLVANVRRDLGDMTLRAQGKVAIENFDSEYTFAQGNDLTVVDTRDLDNAAGSKSVSSSTVTTRSEGYYITGGFDYKDRYIADVLFRRDGSSLFGPENRWNNYYRVSAAYRVSEESWFPAKDFIDEFKLRYSRGTAGGRPSFSWQYETFSLGGGIASKSRLGNPFLKPELQTEQEFGVEASFGGRVYAELVYAQSEVKDQLIVVPLPAFAGYPDGQYANAGTVESNTIEATINASVLQTRDYSLDLGLIFDRTRGEITEFNRPGYLTGFGLGRNLFFLREGEEIGAIYGDQWVETSSQLATTFDGSGANLDAFQKNDDGLFVPVGVGNSYKDMMWGTMVDIDGDGDGDLPWGNPVKFTNEEGVQQVRIGSVVPDFNLGLNTTFNIKGVSLYMLWNAQVGGDIYNGTRQWAYREDGVGGHHGDQDQAGKAEELKKPITYYQNLYNVNAPNSWFVEDGTYVKLRELSLRYTFDRAMLNKIGLGTTLNRIAVSAVGRNLLTFTDYSGFDPEVGSALYRVDHFVYPNFRTFTGVVEIEF